MTVFSWQVGETIVSDVSWHNCDTMEMLAVSENGKKVLSAGKINSSKEVFLFLNGEAFSMNSFIFKKVEQACFVKEKVVVIGEALSDNKKYLVTEMGVTLPFEEGYFFSYSAEDYLLAVRWGAKYKVFTSKISWENAYQNLLGCSTAPNGSHFVVLESPLGLLFILDEQVITTFISERDYGEEVQFSWSKDGSMASFYTRRDNVNACLLVFKKVTNEWSLYCQKTNADVFSAASFDDNGNSFYGKLSGVQGIDINSLSQDNAIEKLSVKGPGIIFSNQDGTKFAVLSYDLEKKEYRVSWKGKFFPTKFSFCNHLEISSSGKLLTLGKLKRKKDAWRIFLDEEDIQEENLIPQFKPKFSPDGKHILFFIKDPNEDIYIRKIISV